MQAVIQGFPDDFHLGTLPSLLSAVGKLQPGVKIHTVLSSLLDRLARHTPLYTCQSAKALPHLPACPIYQCRLLAGEPLVP